MEKTRMKYSQFDTHLSNQRKAYVDGRRSPSPLVNGFGFARAAVGAVVLLLKAVPLNPLSRLR